MECSAFVQYPTIETHLVSPHPCMEGTIFVIVVVKIVYPCLPVLYRRYSSVLLASRTSFYFIGIRRYRDRTQESCEYGIGRQTLDLIHTRLVLVVSEEDLCCRIFVKFINTEQSFFLIKNYLDSM